MKHTKLLVASLAAALAALLAVTLVGPAVAHSGDAYRQREQARARRATLAKQLDSVRASDAQLDQAVAALDAHIATQSAKVAAARQAVAAAEVELADYTRRLAETEARVGHLRTVLVERAVQAFVHPSSEIVGELVNSADFGEAVRKHALLDHVTSNDRDVIDQLNAAIEDLGHLREAAAAAAEKAQERRAEAESRLSELEGSRSALAEKRRALDARRRELLSEISAQAATESKLSRLIQAEQARSARGSAARVGGGPASASGLIWPVRGRVTSEYGTRWGRLHAGIDIGAPTGTPIVAAKDGVVIQSGSMNGYGNVVIIDHGGGFSTVYAHQSRIAARQGQRVGRGQLIGYVGSTGRSTGPHLHFETRVNGQPRNPRNYLP